jgi:signal transduction histidine kinase
MSPTWQQLVTVCLGVAAIIGAATGLGRLGLAVWRGARRLSRMLDEWLGDPGHPGIPGSGRPSVLARLAAIEEGQRLAREVQDEHGRRLAAIEEGQRATREEVAEQGRQLSSLSTRVARVEQELRPERPTVEAASPLVVERAGDEESAALRYGFAR